MAKKVTCKELGIPKGVRLCTSFNNKIVDEAVIDVFGDKIQDMVTRELALFKHLVNVMYSDETRAVHETYVQYLKLNLDPSIVESDIIMKEVWNVSFYVTDDNDCREVGFGLYSGFRGDRGLEYFSVCPKKICKSLLEDKSIKQRIPAIIKTKYIENSFWEHFLDNSTKDKVTIYLNDADALIKQIGDFKENVWKILAYYSSILKLCSQYTEFIYWIKKAAAQDEPTTCTDIPAADCMVEVNSIIKEVKGATNG